MLNEEIEKKTPNLKTNQSKKKKKDHKKYKGQNQKKYNLKGWYENVEGKHWFLDGKRKDKKRKRCWWRIRGPMTTHAIQERKGGWDKSNDAVK